MNIKKPLIALIAVLLLLFGYSCTIPVSAKAPTLSQQKPVSAYTPSTGALPARAQKTPAPKPTKGPKATPTATPAGTNPGSGITNTKDFNIILGRPTTNSIAVSLLSSSDQQIKLAYGSASGKYTIQTSLINLKAGVPQTIQLSNLLPDSAYYYTVLSGTNPSAEYSFHTQRLPGEAFTFTIDSDPHNREPNFSGAQYAATLNNVLADHPDFHVNLGDTFMTEKIGAKTYAEAASTFTDMRPYFGLLNAGAPLFLVNGNHEGELGWLSTRGTDQNLPIWSTQLRQLYYPNPIPGDFYTGSASPDPLLGTSRDGYYSWTWGDALFVVLDPYWYTSEKARPDDANGNWGWTLGKTQYDWLNTTLQGSSSKFKFVFIHNLVGGSGKDARGGIEAAPYFEWGGKNADGAEGFSAHRPGWAAPIHQLLVQNHVSAVFHGHDHVYVQQELDGIIYQELPQPSNTQPDNTRLATDYGYTHGTVLPGSGHLRVTVTSEVVTIDFVRASLSTPQNAQIAGSYTIPNR